MRNAAGPLGTALVVGAVGAKVPATPNADEARQAATKELSRRIYQDEPGLWERILRWIADLLTPHSLVPGVPSWASTTIVFLVGGVVIALLGLLATRITSARKVRTEPLSVLTDDRDAAALTRAANEAAERSDFATAVIERFRAIIRSLDEHGIIDVYPGLTALEAAELTYRALGEHRLVAPLYEAAHLFDAVLYGRVVSTRVQDQQMRELAEQVATVTVPAGRHDTLVNVPAAVPGVPA